MMRSGGGHLERAFRVRLTANVGQVDRQRSARCEIGASARRLPEGRPVLPVRLEVAQMIDSEHRRGGGDPGFRNVSGWYVETAHPQPVEVRRDGERATDWTHGAVEGELSEPRRITREGAVAGGIDHRRRDCQVKAGALLREVGRGEVDGDPPTGELKAAVVDRDLHPLTGFLERTIAKSHDVEAREAVGDVRLHFNPDTIEAEDRPGEGPGQHQGRYYTSLCIGVS